MVVVYIILSKQFNKKIISLFIALATAAGKTNKQIVKGFSLVFIYLNGKRTRNIVDVNYQCIQFIELVITTSNQQNTHIKYQFN